MKKKKRSNEEKEDPSKYWMRVGKKNVGYIFPVQIIKFINLESLDEGRQEIGNLM